MMLTTREIEKRNQYGKICRYLETVFKNNLYGYNIIELCEYDVTMPAEIKEWLTNDPIIYDFVDEKYKNMQLKHELSELQKKIDVQTKKLNKAWEEFFYGNK